MLASRIKWNLTICIQDALKSLLKVMSSQEKMHKKVSAELSPLQSIKVCRAGNSSWPLANFRPFSTFVRPKLTLAGHYVQAIKSSYSCMQHHTR